MEEQLQALESQMLSQPGETALKVGALLAESRRVGDAHAEAYALCLLGGCAFFQGDHARTIACVERSLALARQHGFAALQARCSNALGLSFWRLGQLPEALEHFHTSLATAGQDDLAGRSRVLNNLAAIYNEMEDYERALTHFRDAVELAERSDRPDYAADALVGMADTLYSLGRHDEAMEALPKAKALAQQYDLVRMTCKVAQVEAFIHNETGHVAEALICAQEGMRAALKAQDNESQAFLHWVLTDIYIQQNELGRAHEELGKAEAQAQQIRHLLLQCELKQTRSRLHELEGNPVEALAALNEHLRLKKALAERSRMLQRQAVTQQIQLELLQREAQSERQRSAELLLANQRLQDTQAELSYQASHDTLTGLLNRAAFWEQTEQRLLKRSPQAFAGIIFIDIDNLKTVNDAYGHARGDALIMEIAQRFAGSLREGDLIGRLSGDEFMVYLPNLSAPEEAEKVASVLLGTLQEPLLLGDLVLQPRASMGVVVAPLDGEELRELHHHADLALYQAKQQGRNSWMRFEAEISAAEKRRRQLKEDLRLALAQQQCELHYQPQFTLKGRELVGVEALLRWQHPQLGWISPAEFIPIAEEGPLIVELGQWVLEEGCRQAQRWGFAERGLVMSLNVSVRQFERADFVQCVASALAASGLPGDCLMLELTETMLHQEAETSTLTVEALHQMGVKIAIDDFGTGYSSLRLLKQLPFRQLKVDRSFVNDLTASGQQFTSARHFMEVMLNLAHGLGMRVVAEGVETQEQFDLLSEMGCEKAQGYLLSRPLKAADLFAQFLASPPEETSV